MRVRAQRLRLSLAEVQQRSAAICARLTDLPAFANARRVFAYVSRGHEVMTHELIQQMLAAGREVGMPAYDTATDTYRASLVEQFPDDLHPGKLDILEPRAVRPVGLDQFEVLLVPGVAFDVHGHRLGRGKGYFDRLLEGARGVKIGLAYEFEVLAEVPVAAHDVPMDLIVTETKTFHCQRNP
jgi:5-formyltetrahydrofolate cyclo-ligase